MTATGWLLRAQLRDIDTPLRASQRVVDAYAVEVIEALRHVLWPVLTAENVREVLAWQQDALNWRSNIHG